MGAIEIKEDVRIMVDTVGASEIHIPLISLVIIC